jgi:hypothetical protein
MSPRKKRFTVIGLVLLSVLAASAWLAWSPAMLWLAKRDAATKYADMQDAETLNVALAPNVRQINDMAGAGEQERIAAVVDGYRFSFPAAKYQRLPGQYVDFDSGKLTVRCLGVLDLTGEFAKAATDDSAVGQYLAKTDSFQILVDAFNARPKDIEQQASIEALNKHLALLLIKTVLMPIGADKHWERFDTDKHPGIIAGDTSMRGIMVTVYLPEQRKFADILIRPKDGATMADVYAAIAELEVSQDASSQTGEGTEVLSPRERMRQVSLAIHMYAVEYAAWPSSLPDLVTAKCIGWEVIAKPGEAGNQQRYVYIRPSVAWDDIDEPAPVMLYEAFASFPEGGIAVGFADGAVTSAQTEEEFRGIMEYRNPNDHE